MPWHSGDVGFAALGLPDPHREDPPDEFGGPSHDTRYLDSAEPSEDDLEQYVLDSYEPDTEPEWSPGLMSRHQPVRPLTDREIAAARVVLGLVQSNKKIPAIKQYRQMTGRGLKDAKDVIDALAADPASVLPPIPAPAPADGMVTCAYCRSQVSAGQRCGNCGAKS